MTEEPYRWLEAIQNRREYIEDQLAPGLPVVAVSADPGILLLAQKTTNPKLFEIYDHLALASLGHPADIEKVRQTVIDAAHVEGFTRSPQDVSARRLVSYNLAPALKNAFEQIYSAPLLFRGILAELGSTPQDDSLWRVDYDGGFSSVTSPTLVAGPTLVNKEALPLLPEIDRSSWQGALLSGLRLLVWAKRKSAKESTPDDAYLTADLAMLKTMLGADLETSVLDRSLHGQTIQYRELTASELGR